VRGQRERTRRPALLGAARAGEPRPYLSCPKLFLSIYLSISVLADPRWRSPDSCVLLFWLKVSAPARVRGRGCQLRLRRHAGAPPRSGPCRDPHQVSKSQLRLSFRCSSVTSYLACVRACVRLNCSSYARWKAPETILSVMS